MITTLEDLEKIIKEQLLVQGISAEAAFISVAASTASRETNITFPLSHSEEEYWVIRRGLRHSYEALRVKNAKKFRVDKMHLDQRFGHYSQLVQEEDQAFKEALEENPFLFPKLTNTTFENYITYIPFEG
jgi:hypothetical protein